MDIQPLAIKTVKEKAAARSLTNVETVLTDSYNTGIPGSTADVVLFIDAIQSISDTNSLFREINRLLKAGGLLFLEPGHWKPSRVKEVVEQTGLFHTVKFDGRNMLLAKKGSERGGRK